MAIPIRTIRRKPKRDGEEVPVTRRRRLLRRPGKRVLTAGAMALIVAVVAAAVLIGGGTKEPAGARTTSLEFATIRRTDLVSVKNFDGTVASKDGPAMTARINGTITSMGAEGTLVDRGHTLYEVDGQPVVLFIGTVPAWRAMGGSITGEDVKQLEENLEALGYEAGVVDETFTSTTTAAVQAWQDDLGLTADGVVPLGRIVFAPSALTIAGHEKTVGSAVRDGENVLTTVSSEKVVSIALSDADDLASGDEVSVVLPGNTRADATVGSVETSTEQSEDGASIIATAVPADAGALGDLEDGADVDVELVQESREGVLVVPVTALVARRGGGYAVEVQRGATTSLVTVEPGLYADDLVEISGDVEEGDRVVVP